MFAQENPHESLPNSALNSRPSVLYPRLLTRRASSTLPASISVSPQPRCPRDAECSTCRESAASPATVARATPTQLDKHWRYALSRPHPMPRPILCRGRRRPETMAGNQDFLSRNNRALFPTSGPQCCSGSEYSQLEEL